LNPGRVVTPNRISSSGRHGSDPFMLDQRARPVLSVRRRTALNCNPNCNPQIRRSGHIVQGCPWRSVPWADIPAMSTPDRCCLAAWQQCWQQSRRDDSDPRPSAFQAGHIPSWRGSCERYALSPVAAGSRWLLPLLSSAPRVRARPAFLARLRSLGAAPSSIGLTAADPFAGGEVSRADSRDALTRHLHLRSLP
jgi:hypothetical protein